MKITFVSMLSVVKTPPESYGGSETINWAMAQMLARKGHDVTLIALEGSHVPWHGALIGIEPLQEYNQISQQRESDRLFNRVDVVDALKSADVVIDASDYKLGAQWVFDNRPDKSALIWYSNGTSWQNPKTHRNCVALSKFHALMAVYNSTGYEGFNFPDRVGLTRGLVIDNCDYMYAPFFPEEYPYREDKPQGEYYVNISRFHPDKGQQVFLYIAQKMPDSKFIMAGSTQFEAHKEFYEKNVKPMADKLPNVTTILNPTESEKKELFAGAKAFINVEGIQTPYINAYGITNIESLLMGTAVVASPSGATPELVRNGIDGFMFMNDFQLRKALTKLPQIKRKNCREGGERFTPDKVYPHIEEVLTKVKKGDHW